MWRTATGTEAFREATRGAVTYRQHMLRLFGIPESEIAATLRAAEQERGIPLAELEITTCLRRGEIEVVTRYEPPAEEAYQALEALIRERHSDTLFSDDGTSIDDQVAALLSGPPVRTIAVAESCTGGLVTARLTERPGSSAYVLGGVTAYADSAKVDLVGVNPEVIETHGAVSPEVAGALADGAVARFGADIGVGLTGIAGPDGGTDEKPVGYVCFCVVERGGGRVARDIRLPGARVDVRDRSTTVCFHLIRRLLLGERDDTLSGEAEPARA
jgi:nicotinamide-nucleotide amidase